MHNKIIHRSSTNSSQSKRNIQSTNHSQNVKTKINTVAFMPPGRRCPAATACLQRPGPSVAASPTCPLAAASLGHRPASPPARSGRGEATARRRRRSGEGRERRGEVDWRKGKERGRKGGGDGWRRGGGRGLIKNIDEGMDGL
uniref:Uncharacterized protein n=1 Tax=Oryza sativa subsp. japonica TaxID=39947 RepID=Q6YTF3_ORYSJ|nr:hypothetical protein [Oryza sativa Japonica Group]